MSHQHASDVDDHLGECIECGTHRPMESLADKPVDTPICDRCYYEDSESAR